MSRNLEAPMGLLKKARAKAQRHQEILLVSYLLCCGHGFFKPSNLFSQFRIIFSLRLGDFARLPLNLFVAVRSGLYKPIRFNPLMTQENFAQSR